MTGGSLGLRPGSYGSLQQLQIGVPHIHAAPILFRKSSKNFLSNAREKDRFCLIICRYLGKGKVAMLLMVFLALLVFINGSFTVNKG